MKTIKACTNSPLLLPHPQDLRCLPPDHRWDKHVNIVGQQRNENPPVFTLQMNKQLELKHRYGAVCAGPCPYPSALAGCKQAERQGGRGTLPGSPDLHWGALITTIMEPDRRSSQGTPPRKPNHIFSTIVAFLLLEISTSSPSVSPAWETAVLFRAC